MHAPTQSDPAPPAATSPSLPRREFGTGARVAIGLAAAAPLMAFAVATAQNLWAYSDIQLGPVYQGATWLLLVVALVSAAAISRSFWCGIPEYRLSPLPLLLLSTLPCWLIGEGAGQYVAMEVLRSGAGGPWAHAEASTLRLAGQFFAWSLTGSVTFGLAIAGFLARAPGARLSGAVFAWASLVPLIVFVLSWVISGDTGSRQASAGVLAYALISMPLVLGLTGAAIGDGRHPHADWLVAVAAGGVLTFVAIVTVSSGQALINAEIGMESPNPAAIVNPVRVFGLGIAGLVLAALPLLAFAKRLSLLPGASAWGLIAVPAALAAIAVALGAAPPGDGLAGPYLRRLDWLAAFVIAAPISIWAIRRMTGMALNMVANGLLLAVLLAALQSVAMQPGLLLVLDAPRARAPAPLPEEAGSARADETEAPASPRPRTIESVQPELSGRAPSTDPPWTDEGRVDHGPAFDHETAGSASGMNIAAAPSTPIRVIATDLNRNLTSSPTTPPPPELLTGPPRHVVMVKVEVDATGTVSGTHVIRSSGNVPLDTWVQEQLRLRRYRPWMVQGRAVPVEAEMTVVFNTGK